ncbi:MAG: hypothetical protein ACYCST_12145 [Acidimicrobiales bacterium]
MSQEAVDNTNCLAQASIPSYAILGNGDELCEHILLVPMSNGESVPCFRLPVACASCRDRFDDMVLAESAYVLDRCDGGGVWVRRIPAHDDPARDGWHLLVGRRIQAFGKAGAAFVVQVADESVVVSTNPLWGCGGRMLKARWSEVPGADVRRELEHHLGAGDIARAEMFYRSGFLRWVMPLHPSGWAVPLVDRILVDLFGGVDVS